MTDQEFANVLTVFWILVGLIILCISSMLYMVFTAQPEDFKDFIDDDNV